MASLQSVLPGGFDAAAVEPQENRSYGPLPGGVYDVEITDTDLKDNSKGSGSILKVEYTVVAGPSAKRKVWQNINITNASSEAERIGQAQLSALCRAVGIPKLTDSDQLFQKLLRISVKVRPARDGYEASNDVTGYEPMNTPRTPAAAAAPSRQGSAPAASVPWAKAK